MMRFLRRLILIGLLALSGCGFHLKNTATLPFSPIYVDGGGSLRAPLRQAIRYSGADKLTDNPTDAVAILQILSENTRQDILTIDATGRVAEYRLIYTVSFRLHDNHGHVLLPPQTIELQRDLTYSDSQVLSKGLEADLLYKDMREDATNQIMRRISVVRPLP